MVVLVVHAVYVISFPTERDAPVAAHLYGPRALPGAAQFVKIQARQVHIARARRRVQTAEDQPEPVGVFRLNSRLGPGGEVPFESFVPKPLDRRAYQCNLCGYRLQPTRGRPPATAGPGGPARTNKVCPTKDAG
jgi:rubredoxin